MVAYLNPRKFLWGAATSSHQVEGHNIHNDWWAWEQEGHIEGGVRSETATDHWNRFREDIQLAADLGLTSYRFSIEWSRLEPEPGKWDRASLEWYSELIAECERNGLLPMLTLHHFTSPKWFAEKNGFCNENAPNEFVAYVEYVAKNLGSRIPLWCTFNEPMVLAVGTYIAKIMPPAIFSPASVSIISRNLLRSHVRAYETLHSQIPERKGPWKDLPVQVGIAHSMLDFMPDRAWHPLDQLLSFTFHRFYNLSWLDAVTGRAQRFSLPFLVPRSPVVKEALSRRTVDFIGINYYTKAYVQWRPRDTGDGKSAEMPLGIVFARRREPMSDVGWAIHPQGLMRVMKAASRYGLPIYITENGIADREDQYRAEYLKTHVQQIQDAIAAGLDIRGYYYWSLLDNFEWIKGFGPRFGLFAVNYDSFERSARSSVTAYKSIIDTANRDAPRTFS